MRRACCGTSLPESCMAGPDGRLENLNHLQRQKPHLGARLRHAAVGGLGATFGELPIDGCWGLWLCDRLEVSAANPDLHLNTGRVRMVPLDAQPRGGTDSRQNEVCHEGLNIVHGV